MISFALLFYQMTDSQARPPWSRQSRVWLRFSLLKLSPDAIAFPRLMLDLQDELVWQD